MTDSALEWMSFRRSGRIGDLTSDLIGGANARRFVADLVTLGHAEWTESDAWRIAPPVLAGLGGNGEFAAVLCGARTPKLLDSLAQVCSTNATLIRTLGRVERPSTIIVTAASDEALANAAARVGIPFQGDAALRILACTPSIREWPCTPCPMVQGQVEMVRRFSRSRLDWVTSTLAEASIASTGFFRIQRDWDRVSLIKGRATGSALMDDRAGRMATAARCKVVRWSQDTKMLSLPAQLYPPGVMARAIALCSGELPSFDRETRQISFAGVRLEHVRLILAISGLRLA